MKRSSFIEGTFIATLAIIIVKILGMLYVIPFYAIVGTEGAALYSYAYNIYNIFLDISTVGLPIAISKITNEYNTLKMYDAKERAFKIAISFMRFVSIVVFILLFIFADPIAKMIIGDLEGGNSAVNIANVIRFVDIAILVIPYLSVTKGYLQGHNIVNVSSTANILEQVVRIAIILLGSYFVMHILGYSYVSGVEVALTGAFFGGLAAYSYVRRQIKKNPAMLSTQEKLKKDPVTNKEITKKIASYAIPFIIINSVASLYSFVDMILIMRGLEHIGYATQSIEFIATAISTWATKINMIIISIAMGMTISLIPSIVTSYTLKKWHEVNKKINSALKMIIFISIPMAIGLSMLASSVWSIFYGANETGAIILSLSVFVAVALNFYMITSSILQSLNKFKAVYQSAICGFLSNAILDLPLIFLFNKVGIPAYLGALVASIIGYLLSSFIALKSIKKEEKQITYQDSIQTFLKVLIPSFCMIIVLLLLRLIPYNVNSRISCLFFIILNSLIGSLVYFYISYKMGLISSILGKDFLLKIKKKLTHKK